MCSHFDSISSIAYLDFTQFLPCFYDFLVFLPRWKKNQEKNKKKCDGKSAWKNIKYDHIDKNKIINLCQFLCRCYCIAKQYYYYYYYCWYYWKKKMKTFSAYFHFFFFWYGLRELFQPWNVNRECHSQSAFFVYEMRANQFSFQNKKKLFLDDFERFDGNFLLLLSNFKHHSIDFIYYRWLVPSFLKRGGGVYTFNTKFPLHFFSTSSSTTNAK